MNEATDALLTEAIKLTKSGHLLAEASTRLASPEAVQAWYSKAGVWIATAQYLLSNHLAELDSADPLYANNLGNVFDRVVNAYDTITGPYKPNPVPKGDVDAAIYLLEQAIAKTSSAAGGIAGKTVGGAALGFLSTAGGLVVLASALVLGLLYIRRT